MAIKFPLKMKNDMQVRTLEELREHFDLAAVLGYYNNGRLVEWLEGRYYDDEVKKIKALDSSADDFKRNLCDIFGVSFAENDDVSVTGIAVKNERRERLKMFTADDKILAAVDSVAFSQEELIALLDGGAGTVYLCGERFTIPWSIPNVTYIGVTNPNPKVNISDEHTGNYTGVAAGLADLKVDASANHIGRGIVFQNLHLEIYDIIRLAKAARCPTEPAALGEPWVSHEEAAALWRIAAEHGNAEAQLNLGRCYYYGTGISKNVEEAVKWYRKAAEQGYAEAQYRLGKIYFDIESDEYEDCVVEQDYDEALKWYRKAAEQGFAEAQYTLTLWHLRGAVTLNAEEASRYIKAIPSAAERGIAGAQYLLAEAYMNGSLEFERNAEKSAQWLLKAAEQDDEYICSIAGMGDGNYAKEAEIEVYKYIYKAAEEGNIIAQYLVVENSHSGMYSRYGEAKGEWYDSYYEYEKKRD